MRRVGQTSVLRHLNSTATRAAKSVSDYTDLVKSDVARPGSKAPEAQAGTGLADLRAVLDGLAGQPWADAERKPWQKLAD